VGSARFGSFQLLILGDDGVVQPAPYIPDPGDTLYPALLALRARICPGAVAIAPRPGGRLGRAS
jgi:hypothetical protein